MSLQLERALLLAVALGASALLVMVHHTRTVPPSTSYLPAAELRDIDPEYATAAFCAREPVKGGDAQLIAEWGKAHHIDCRGVN